MVALRRFLLAPAVLISVFALISCAAPASSGSDEEVEASEEAVSDGPATALVTTSGSETRVRAAGMSMWVESVAAPRRVGADLWITMRLRTSRSLDSAMSFVPDDGFGDARLVSPRVVEVGLRGGHEINSILSGLPLFVHLHTTSGTVRDYEARLDLAPRFARFSGTSSISIDRDVRPVLVKSGTNDLRYRGRVTSSGASSMSVVTTDHADPVVTAAGPGAWRFDWAYDALETTADAPSDRVQLSAKAGSTTRTKSAGLDLVVSKIGLTKESAYDVWPSPECTPAVTACIEGQPAGATDFGDCGAYRQVSRCMQQLSCVRQVYPRTLGTLSAVKSQVNAACAPGGGAWCSMTDLRAFDVGGCEVGPTTLAHVNAAVAAASSAADQGTDWMAGPALTHAALAQKAYFSTHAPGLLAKIDAYVGNANVIATELVAEVPCHNCHDFKVRYVLFYPDTQTVIVVDGSHGYDS